MESIRVQDFKRLVKATHDLNRRPEYRQGTFVKHFDETLSFEERLLDTSQTFINDIQTMHDELSELAKSTQRSRKTLKESCLRHERNLVDAEQNAEKAKSRYYALCEDMEKLKDPTKTKFFKTKNTPQHEQELQSKINSAENEYRQKVDTAKKIRKELIVTLRPQSVKELKNLILECDSGISFQLQKLSNFNETSLLKQGFIICPIKPAGSTTSPLSLKEVVAKIDNELDFYNDMFKIKNSNKPLNRPDINFVQHSYMASYARIPPSSSSSSSHPAPGGLNTTPSNLGSNALKNTGTHSQFNALKPPSQQPNHFKSPSGFNGATTGAAVGAAAGIGASSVAAVLSNTPGSSPAPNSTAGSSAAAAAAATPVGHNSNSMLYPDEPRLTHSANPSVSKPKYPDLSPEPLDSDIYGSSPPPNQPQPAKMDLPIPPAGANLDNFSQPTSPQISQKMSQFPDSQTSNTKSTRYVPTFGSTLDDLIEFEALPVSPAIPQIVTKCVGAITRYGMSMEGIYRQAGDPGQIETLRQMFNEDASAVDLLHPQNYGISDIHAVSGTLKLYFQELPDPLLTKDFHRRFIQAAEIDSDQTRRESIHGVVNDLPDSNYSVLKFLSLHLAKVSRHEAQNRMSISTLGNMWGPVLMTSATSDINELALQAKVVETILFFCEEIFEYDDEFYAAFGNDI